ncbi:MAG: thiosulfate sulfurtransferase [Acidiferrobacteraceae bacterium]|nr:thiosulfate sulfurtransferase [Acidiferrobacteraceae bacterium]|tara:strand:- start:2441 stop:3250 length:810 start_codon:yes stop_codon:yes gene_type:complete
MQIVIDSKTLHARLDNPDLRIVSLCGSNEFRYKRIPGAISIDYNEVIDGNKPIIGQIPSNEKLQRLTDRIGLRAGLHVIAYDDEGGGYAARLAWTLHLIGHEAVSVLDGGIHAWLHDGYRIITHEIDLEYENRPHTSEVVNANVLATRDYILARLNLPSLQLLDVRSKEEYLGLRRLALRGGHIPGAVNLEWVQAIDKKRQLRLKNQHELNAMLSELGITHNQEIVVYCQTHHRSAHSWMMLRHLGFSEVRGYAGSWSEWGNDPDTPIE